jgi:hypothetical protein
VTQIPTVTAPAATSGGGKTQTSTYLAIVAALAGLALLAGLVGLFLTRDRTLPAVAGGAPVPPAPLDPPEPAGYWTPPQNDVEHDWGSQTPGPPPPPPPPPGPYEE